MSIGRGGLWIGLLLATALLCGCGRGHKSESVKEIKIVASDLDAEQEPWHLLVYGTHYITIDTLEVSSKGKISYDRTFDLDTLDLLLLRSGDGALQLPMFIDREAEAFSAKINGKGITLKGFLYEELLNEWHAMKGESEEELLDFLSAHSKEKPTPVLVYDGMERYSDGRNPQEWRTLFAQVTREQNELTALLGWRLTAEHSWDSGAVVPYSMEVSGMKDRVTFKALVGKSRIVALNVLELSPEDSLSFAAHKRYFHLLDSLGVPSYSVLLNDALPKGLKSKEKGTKQYFLIDSIGQSQTFLKDQSIDQLPLYMVVDSLQHIERSWSTPDSLISYIKQQKK
ncbi:hypothetical protein [uncultured Porphyromonas sp.]|uniref:hypothetical protein n=1 Tax=uncultured Porphyromonas sp. TaxID=159274 RepID=UPI002613321B|nr:hypothetical protein [uncultured Porphyromonas sp.]